MGGKVSAKLAERPDIHEDIIGTIRQGLMESVACHLLLFYGPPGTGKTSTILAILPSKCMGKIQTPWCCN